MPIVIGYLAFTLVLATPFLGLLLAAKQRQQLQSTEQQRVTFALMLVSTVPSVFCLIGISLMMLKLNTLELPIYYGLIAMTLIWIKSAKDRAVASVNYSPKVRVVHGITSLFLLVFIAFHLVNHLAANLGGEVHIALMETFRQYYRHPIVEVLLIGLFVVQFITGWLLARAFISQKSDGYRTLQVATGLILLMFISTHVIAVIGLARLYFDTDPNWDWLVSYPLLQDAWSVRLISHYIIGIIALILHMALGLRIVLNNHGKERLANRLVAIAFVVAVVIAVAIMRPLLLPS